MTADPFLQKAARERMAFYELRDTLRDDTAGFIDDIGMCRCGGATPCYK